MQHTIRLTLAVFALAVSGAANATFIEDLGVLGPPGFELFGNSFNSAVGDFSDEYRFSLSGPAVGFGGTLEIDPLSFLDINIESVALWRDGALVGSDWTPGVFSFDGLIAGTYSLFVNGTATRGRGFDDIFPTPVSYAGSITTVGTRIPVPEPGTLTLLGLSLVGFGLKTRRRAR